MSIDFPPPRDDALALLPLLEEAERLQETPPCRDTGDILPLLEENARLRKLAVRLSNLLGDLPEDANRNC
ncbi:MAG: hypothetical protein PS018_26865 [bacterium]|nr:hypothetical protein [bacterium]